MHEATYNGTDSTVTDPFVVDLLASAVYGSLTSQCSVDEAAVAAAFDTSSGFEFAAEETYRQANCITVPIADLPFLVAKVDNVFDFDADPVTFAR